MTGRLRIAIAPEARRYGGAAVDWIWRQVFTAIGYCWTEVSLDEPSDIVYALHPNHASQAKLGIVVSPERWQKPAHCELAGVSWGKPPLAIRFVGESQSTVAVDGSNGRLWLPRDIIFDLFWLLTGQEEHRWSQDAHGFYTLPDRWLAQAVLEQAPASALIESLGSLIRALGVADPLPRWPKNKRAAAAITHDVDYPEVIRWLEPLRILRRQHGRGIGAAWQVLTGRRTHWAFPQWMAFEDRFGVRSAFYFVARRGSLFEYARGTPDPFYDVDTSRFRALFRTLLEGGWEVGMHASYLAYTSLEGFAAEKERLETAAGAPIAGNRHHYWHMNPTDPEATLQMHAELGLLYDTSLTHDRYLGWRRGSNVPFMPFAPCQQHEIGTVQLPVAWMDAQVMARGDLTQPAREAIVCKLVDRAASQHGLFVANVHDYVYDDALFPGWLATLRAALARIVECGDFWVATPAEIARHWLERYQYLQALSTGLQEGL